MAGPRSMRVRQDADGIWLGISLAMQRTGLTRAELVQAASGGDLRTQEWDRRGVPVWFHEEDVTRLARQRQTTPAPAKPKRRMTDAQLEAMHTRTWKKEAETRRYRGGQIGNHLEGVMLHDIAANNKRKTDPKP